jgi:hypothetical protein
MPSKDVIMREMVPKETGVRNTAPRPWHPGRSGFMSHSKRESGHDSPYPIERDRGTRKSR